MVPPLFAAPMGTALSGVLQHLAPVTGGPVPLYSAGGLSSDSSGNEISNAELCPSHPPGALCTAGPAPYFVSVHALLVRIIHLWHHLSSSFLLF